MLRVSVGAGFLSWLVALNGCASGSAPVAAPTPLSAPPAASAVAEPRALSSAPPAPAEPAVQGPSLERFTPALAGALEDGYGERQPDRVKVAREAVARPRFDSVVSETSKEHSDIVEMVVLEVPSDPKVHAVRVVVDTKSVRVALWFDHAELERVAIDRAAFGSSRTSALPERGAIAYPGLRLSVVQEEAERAAVVATYEFPSPDSGVITLEGWLERSKIGFVYRPGSLGTAVARGKPFFLAKETEIWGAPAGVAVARVRKGGQGVFFPVSVLREQRGQAELELRTPELELRGFVSTESLEDLEPETHRGWGRGHFEAELWQRWPKEQVKIERGTCIYDAPGGEPIGVVKQAQIENVVIEDKASDYRAYRLPHRAVAYLHTADLVRNVGPSPALSKETLQLARNQWTCPKR